MKAVVAAFNQEKALVGAFSVITNLRMELFKALSTNHSSPGLQIVAGNGDPRPRSRPRLVPAQPLVNARVFAILLLKQKLN